MPLAGSTEASIAWETPSHSYDSEDTVSEVQSERDFQSIMQDATVRPGNPLFARLTSHKESVRSACSVHCTSKGTARATPEQPTAPLLWIAQDYYESQSMFQFYDENRPESETFKPMFVKVAKTFDNVSN